MIVLYNEIKKNIITNGLFAQTKNRLKHSTHKINCLLHIFITYLIPSKLGNIIVYSSIWYNIIIGHQ